MRQPSSTTPSDGITHDPTGKVPQLHGQLTHPQDLDAPMHLDAQKKIKAYRDEYANHQNTSAHTTLCITLRLRPLPPTA